MMDRLLPEHGVVFDHAPVIGHVDVMGVVSVSRLPGGMHAERIFQGAKIEVTTWLSVASKASP